MTDLFNNQGYVEPVKPTKFCRTCAHREPWGCGLRTVQYCGIRESKRTVNGLLRIKVTNPACAAYKEGKNYWEQIKRRNKQLKRRNKQ